MADQSLTAIYHDWIASSIDEKGIEIPHGLVIEQDGNMTVFALALPPPEAYVVMLSHWASTRPKEMIFAFDRFARPGQGTTLGDLMGGHHFTRDRPRPFIVEYQHDPRLVKPIDWHNEFWNAALNNELHGSARPTARTAGAA